LTIITKVLEIQLENVDKDLGTRLINKSLEEMTKDKELVPDWQGQASSVLVCLGRRFPREIVDSLLKLFKLQKFFVEKLI